MRGFVVIIPVAAFAQTGKGVHADGREFRGRAVGRRRPMRAEAQSGNVEALRTVVVEVGEPIKAVADGENGGRINGEKVVQLSGVDTAKQTPAGLSGRGIKPGVAGFERVVPQVAQAARHQLEKSSSILPVYCTARALIVEARVKSLAPKLAGAEVGVG